MIMHKNLGSKNTYKIFLASVKYLPLILLILKIINIGFCYFGIVTIIFPFLGGTSLLLLILLHIIAEIFRYCYLYKMPLYYLTFSDLFLLLTKIVLIDTIDMYRIIFITFGVFMVMYITYAYLNRNKPKVDPIKNFCERCCNC